MPNKREYYCLGLILSLFSLSKACSLTVYTLTLTYTWWDSDRCYDSNRTQTLLPKPNLSAICEKDGGRFSGGMKLWWVANIGLLLDFTNQFQHLFIHSFILTDSLVCQSVVFLLSSWLNSVVGWFCLPYTGKTRPNVSHKQHWLQVMLRWSMCTWISTSYSRKEEEKKAFFFFGASWTITLFNAKNKTTHT